MDSGTKVCSFIVVERRLPGLMEDLRGILRPLPLPFMIPLTFCVPGLWAYPGLLAAPGLLADVGLLVTAGLLIAVGLLLTEGLPVAPRLLLSVVVPGDGLS